MPKGKRIVVARPHNPPTPSTTTRVTSVSNSISVSSITLTSTPMGKEKFIVFPNVLYFNDLIMGNPNTKDEFINLTPTCPVEAILGEMCKEFDAFTLANRRVLEVSVL